MQTEQQIIRIKHLLNNKSLSFIIGAGFSKNMSNKFFDWGDLLKPIITEMYHTLIPQHYYKIFFLST